jgi:type I restriction enzyme S subunit
MGKWPMVRLGDVCEVAAGQGAPQDAKDYSDDGIAFIRAGHLYDLLNGILCENDIPKINETVAKKHKLKLYPNKTILFAKSGMSSTKGYIYMLRNDCYVVNHLACLIPKTMSPDFLKYALLRYPPNGLIKDESYPSISLTDISAFCVPLPSLPVQQKIAGILDRASIIIEKRKAQINKLDLLVKSQFIEMFGDPVTNQKRWERRKLSELSIKVTDGVHAKPQYKESGMPFISVVNINKGVIDFADCKYVSIPDFERMIKSTNPEYGDILYTKVGATYGIPAHVDTYEKFCLYVSVCLIKPDHSKIDSRFLSLSMGLPYIKQQADNRIRGIGVPDLHLNQIREFDILYPPIELQRKYVDFVRAADKSKYELQRGLCKLESLHNSLMQKCFNGEVLK